MNGFWRGSDLAAHFYTMSSAPVAPSLAQGCAGLGRIAVAQRQEAIGNTPHAELGACLRTAVLSQSLWKLDEKKHITPSVLSLGVQVEAASFLRR